MSRPLQVTPALNRFQWLPVASLLVSTSMWGLLWLPSRALQAHGLSGLWTTFIIFGTPMCLGLPWLIARRAEVLAHPAVLTLAALANGWCNTAFILSVLEGNVVRVLLLFYLSPLWAVLLARVILGERLTGHAKATLALAMTGAVLMLWNPSLEIPWPRDAADWLAISSGFGFALSNVLVRRLGDISVPVKTAASWCGVTAVAAVMLLVQGKAFPSVSPGVIGGAVALGLLGISIMTVTVLYGVTHMPIHRSAVILLFELVAGTVSSQLLTDEVVTAREWAGGVLIVSASWFAALAHLRRPRGD